MRRNSAHGRLSQRRLVFFGTVALLLTLVFFSQRAVADVSSEDTALGVKLTGAAILNVLGEGDAGGPEEPSSSSFLDTVFERAAVCAALGTTEPTSPETLDSRGGGGSSDFFSLQDFDAMLTRSIGKWLLRQITRNTPTEQGPDTDNAMQKRAMAAAEASRGLPSLRVDDDVSVYFPPPQPTDEQKERILDALQRALHQKEAQRSSETSRRAAPSAARAVADAHCLTLAVTDADGRHPLLARLSTDLSQDAFGGLPVGVSLYYTPFGCRSGVPPHRDTMDVIAVQVSGEKAWSLHTGSVPLPLLSQVPNEEVLPPTAYCDGVAAEDDEPGCNGPWSTTLGKLRRLTRTDSARLAGTLPISVITAAAATKSNTCVLLTPGDVLYVPRGVIHNTTSEPNSLRAFGFYSQNGPLSCRIAHPVVPPPSTSVPPSGAPSLHVSIGIEPQPLWTVDALLSRALKAAEDAEPSLGGAADVFYRTADGRSVVPSGGDGCFGVSALFRLLLRAVALLPEVPELRVAVLWTQRKRSLHRTETGSRRSCQRLANHLRCHVARRVAHVLGEPVRRADRLFAGCSSSSGQRQEPATNGALAGAHCEDRGQVDPEAAEDDDSTRGATVDWFAFLSKRVFTRDFAQEHIDAWLVASECNRRVDDVVRDTLTTTARSLVLQHEEVAIEELISTSVESTSANSVATCSQLLSRYARSLKGGRSREDGMVSLRSTFVAFISGGCFFPLTVDGARTNDGATCSWVDRWAADNDAEDAMNRVGFAEWAAANAIAVT